MIQNTPSNRKDFETLCREEAKRQGIPLKGKKMIGVISESGGTEYLVPDMIFESGEVKIAIEVERECHRGDAEKHQNLHRREQLKKLGYLVFTLGFDVVSKNRSEDAITALREIIRRRKSGDKSELKGENDVDVLLNKTPPKPAEQHSENPQEEEEREVPQESQSSDHLASHPEASQQEPENALQSTSPQEKTQTEAPVNSAEEVIANSLPDQKEKAVVIPEQKIEQKNEEEISLKDHKKEPSVQEKMYAEKIEKNVEAKKKVAVSDEVHSEEDISLTNADEELQTPKEPESAPSLSVSTDEELRNIPAHIENVIQRTPVPSKKIGKLAEIQKLQTESQESHISDHPVQHEEGHNLSPVSFWTRLFPALGGSFATFLLVYGYFTFFAVPVPVAVVEPAAPVVVQGDTKQEIRASAPEYEEISFPLPENELFLANAPDHEVIFSPGTSEGKDKILVTIPPNSSLYFYKGAYILACREGAARSKDGKECVLPEGAVPVSEKKNDVTQTSDDKGNLPESETSSSEETKLKAKDAEKLVEISLLDTTLNLYYSDEGKFPEKGKLDILEGIYIKKLPQNVVYEPFENTSGEKCFRISIPLEAKENLEKMQNDGGTNPMLFEAGKCPNSWKEFLQNGTK